MKEQTRQVSLISIFSFILAFSSKLGYEEHIPGQTRDWNEELQTTRELPRKNLPERLLRERAIFKVRRPFLFLVKTGEKNWHLLNRKKKLYYHVIVKL